ncbi:MAG TPA: acyl-CoA dehydrogenase family protein [Rhodothermales bacterium]
MSSPGLSQLRNVSARDQRMIRDIEVMLGPEPTEMGFVKNLFWGRFRGDLVFPYPHESAAERAKCDALLVKLEAYLKNEHPAVEIDQQEYIPDWCFRRLFDMGVMGLTVPEQYGGLGLGVTSYNRVLELIGSYCASTAVVVSAHQSIGCKAIMLFGTPAQKQRFLPGVAREYLSAFCLSEPNVGSDAAAQETYCEKSPDGEFFILNGEKKWSTSAALSGVLTVMARQRMDDGRDGVTALICTPDMEGIEIFEANRSKVGIRGTWQGRIRFNNVRVPRENLLHREGKGLSVALNCLNFGRCTLSAGVLGAAKRAMNQATKWVQTRYQFERPLADFELVQQHLAYMAAHTYAMESMLYMMTGMLDRRDADIMVETAITKVFCSHYGWEAIDRALQVMGGEGFMTENELERTWRDNRIHRVVEGSNEVMHSFIFAYGGKQLAEQMLGIQEAVGWNSEESLSDNLTRIVTNARDPRVLKRAVSLGAQLFLGLRPSAPTISEVHPSLREYAERLARLIPKHSAAFKRASQRHREHIIEHQAVQARLSLSASYLFAMACALSRMDRQLYEGEYGAAFERDRAAFEHFFDLAEIEVEAALGGVRRNADDSMRKAARALRRHNDTLPNSDYYIHEASPNARGTGKAVRTANVRQFPGPSQPFVGPGPAAGEVGGDGHSRATREDR